MTVREALAQHSNTSCISGIVKQVLDATLAAHPGLLVPVVIPRVVGNGHVHLYLQRPSYTSLIAVMQRRPGHTLVVNSCLRDIVSQVAMWTWYREGRPGYKLAAPPGTSPHEQGLALDIQDHASWVPAFEAEGWQYLGEKDPPHVQYEKAGVRHDVAGIVTAAFQVLWNRHNPKDPITADGVAGAATIARVLAAPAEGW